MKAYLRLLLILSLVSPLMAMPNVDTIDTPTAVTLPRASYAVGLWGYNDGGILTKAIVGIHDQIYFGVSFDVENAIGSQQAQFNVPGVIAKIKFTDGWAEMPFLIAAGYDSFYSGKNGKIEGADNPFARVIYGPYAVVTKPIFLFGLQQNLHFGVRTPVQPLYVPEDTSGFVSLDFPIGNFVPMIELGRVYFDADRTNEILMNVGFRFNFFENLSVELDFMMQRGETTNRMLIFEYMDTF